jgi:hypothetical protein
VKRPSIKSRTTRRHHTPQEKAEILKDHRRSGLSVLAFARRRGLCYASLLRWRSQPRQGANAAVCSDPEADPGFVPVKIEGEGLSVGYVLSWPCGRTLQIPLRFETDSLRRLLAVMEDLR